MAVNEITDVPDEIQRLYLVRVPCSLPYHFVLFKCPRSPLLMLTTSIKK